VSLSTIMVLGRMTLQNPHSRNRKALRGDDES
jgi:hypothetical protein